MKYKKIIFGMLLLVTVSACNKKLDSLLTYPNLPSPSSADVDLYLNSVQGNFVGFYSSMEDIGAQLTRQQEWYGPLYANAYGPGTFDGIWTTAYQGIFTSANAMIPLAQAQKKYIQSGIAKVLKAYTLGTLVDNFGDVPYVEANLGIANSNPKADGGAAIYTAVFALLDDAIVDLTKTGAAAGPTNDLFFAGKAANWVTLANTLKFKFLMQERLVDNSVTAKIQTLITANNLINADANNFNSKYATNITAPDSRHPHYAANYTSGGQAGDFIANYFMWEVTAEKTGGNVSSTDPRRRYYFYRQRTNYADVNQQSASCAFQPNPAHYPSIPDQTPFCLVGAGYWGRDHGDNSGIPPDGNLRTTWGIYPAAGVFDVNQGESVTLSGTKNYSSLSGKGGGIEPIWMASFTKFLEAEAALKLGITTAGTPRDLLQSGVTSSINYVLTFPSTVGVTVPASFVPSAAVITNYVNKVLANYDAATTDFDRLDVIMKEYHIALWGNGIEAYNNYRRTGSPNNMQPAVTTANPGLFMRSFFYPAVYATRNLNAAPQKNPGVTADKVFWDNNPNSLFK